MSKNDDGGPAFSRASRNGLKDQEHTYAENGMSLRDYFAAAALTGLIANNGGNATCEDFSVDAYRFADVMIKQRKNV